MYYFNYWLIVIKRKFKNSVAFFPKMKVLKALDWLIEIINYSLNLQHIKHSLFALIITNI